MQDKRGSGIVQGVGGPMSSVYPRSTNYVTGFYIPSLHFY